MKSIGRDGSPSRPHNLRDGALGDSALPESALPRRKGLSHETPPWVPEGSTFFITINCTSRGQNQLAIPAIASLMEESLLVRIEKGYWWPRLTLLMPDHIHALRLTILKAVPVGFWTTRPSESLRFSVLNIGSFRATSFTRRYVQTWPKRHWLVLRACVAQICIPYAHSLTVRFFSNSCYRMLSFSNPSKRTTGLQCQRSIKSRFLEYSLPSHPSPSNTASSPRWTN